MRETDRLKDRQRDTDRGGERGGIESGEEILTLRNRWGEADRQMEKERDRDLERGGGETDRQTDRVYTNNLSFIRMCVCGGGGGGRMYTRMIKADQQT